MPYLRPLVSHSSPEVAASHACRERHQLAQDREMARGHRDISRRVGGSLGPAAQPLAPHRRAGRSEVSTPFPRFLIGRCDFCHNDSERMVEVEMRPDGTEGNCACPSCLAAGIRSFAPQPEPAGAEGEPGRGGMSRLILHISGMLTKLQRAEEKLAPERRVPLSAV